MGCGACRKKKQAKVQTLTVKGEVAQVQKQVSTTKVGPRVRRKKRQ